MATRTSVLITSGQPKWELPIEDFSEDRFSSDDLSDVFTILSQDEIDEAILQFQNDLATLRAAFPQKSIVDKVIDSFQTSMMLSTVWETMTPTGQENYRRRLEVILGNP
jgi:hypothetical protein